MAENNEKKLDDMQATLTLLCDVFRSTRAGGSDNALKEIRVLRDGNSTYAVPVFEDGTGEPNEYFPHGYYAVNISGDSAICAVFEVVEKFARNKW